MNILTIDTENTTWNNGSAFDTRNFNVLIQWTDGTDAGYLYGGGMPEQRMHLQERILQADLVAGFNLKYDLHWLRRLGYILPKRVWCAQIAEFLFSRQTMRYPSLNQVCELYGIKGKLDFIEENYWSKGINTDQIPKEELIEYGMQDVRSTHEVVLKQIERVGKLKTLLNLQMHDLMSLEEIEWNGLKLDVAKMQQKSAEIDKEIAEIQEKLSLLHSVPCFNWSSPAHISALLFGGEIKEVIKVPDGFFKSGAKVGQQRFRNQERVHKLPRMYDPVSGSKLAREGQYSVDEDTLGKIKGGDPELMKSILRMKELQKLNSTYLKGLLDKQTEMHTKNFDIVHGQYNQCVVQTGRLSSSNPNMQNMSGDIQDVFITRF